MPQIKPGQSHELVAQLFEWVRICTTAESSATTTTRGTAEGDRDRNNQQQQHRDQQQHQSASLEGWWLAVQGLKYALKVLVFSVTQVLSQV